MKKLLFFILTLVFVACSSGDGDNSIDSPNINPDIVSAFTLYPTTNTPVSASIVQSDSNYITKVFGNSAKSTDYPVYVQYENKKVSEFSCSFTLPIINAKIDICKLIILLS